MNTNIKLARIALKYDLFCVLLVKSHFYCPGVCEREKTRKKIAAEKATNQCRVFACLFLFVCHFVYFFILFHFTVKLYFFYFCLCFVFSMCDSVCVFGSYSSCSSLALCVCVVSFQFLVLFCERFCSAVLSILFCGRLAFHIKTK